MASVDTKKKNGLGAHLVAQLGFQGGELGFIGGGVCDEAIRFTFYRWETGEWESQ